MSLSTIYFKQNDFIEGKNHLIKAIEIDSENIKYWELYCKICLNLNQFDEVEISFKEILRDLPSLSAKHQNLGQI